MQSRRKHEKRKGHGDGRLGLAGIGPVGTPTIYVERKGSAGGVVIPVVLSRGIATGCPSTGGSRRAV